MILPILFLFTSTNTISAQNYEEQAFTTNKTYDELVAVGNAYFDNAGREKGVGYKPFKRWEYWSRRRLDENGRIISNAQVKKEVERFIEASPDHTKALASNHNFIEMGPMSAVNTSTWSSHLGRLTSVGIDESDNTHLIVGAPSGGVWKTNDTGATWEALFQEQANISVFAVAIDPTNSNVYLAGTQGDGIWRSTDGGTTWTATSGISSGDRINTIKYHPGTANTVFAIGEWYGETYKSTDNGLSWTVVDTYAPNMYDLEFHPSNPNRIFISGNGIVKASNDGGNTFNSVSGPWSNSTSSAIMMATTPHDADYLYVLQETGGGFHGLYLSTDGGATFTTQMAWNGSNNIMGYTQTTQSGQAPRDMDVAVSPNNKNIVNVAGVETWVSNDAGVTFTQSTDWTVGGSPPFIHADVDQLIYDSNNRLFGITDGGIFYSDDDASTWTDISQGIGTRQFYRIGASETEADRVSGGSQDNGTGVTKGGTWYDWLGADGMETFISWDNEDVIIGNIQFGSLYKSINGGVSTTGITQTEGGANGAWVTPTEQDPSNANTYYQAKNEVYKSINGGASWTTISNLAGGLIYELKIDPKDNNIIFAALAHDLFVTTDGGLNWTLVNPTISYSSVNYIAIHPTIPGRVCITLSGTSQRVLESVDGGATWTNIMGALPNIGAECVMYEGDADDAMYVGMSSGLYFKDTANPAWSLVNGPMPNVAVTELEARNGVLYIGTYGRGLWKHNLIEGGPQNFTCATAIDITDCNQYSAVGPSQGSGSTDANATHANWFRYTPIETGNIIIKSCGGQADTRLFVHGGTCGSLTAIGNADNECYLNPDGTGGNLAAELIVPVTMGVPIYLEWTDEWSSDGFDFTIEVDLNFESCSAEVLPSTGTYTTPDMLTCGGVNGASHNDAVHAVWYEYTAPVNGLLSVYSCLGGEDTRLWIYDGTCTALNLLVDDDDTCEMTPGSATYASEVLDLALLAGTTVIIEWDSRWSTNSFVFELEFDPTGPCPPNHVLTGNQTMSEIFETSGTIDSDQIIESPHNVLYDAKVDIDLTHPFEVKLGAIFEAKIDGCP